MCRCLEQEIDCSLQGMTFFPDLSNYNDVKKVNFNYNNISVIPDYAILPPILTHLDISHNLVSGTLASMKNLRIL